MSINGQMVLDTHARILVYTLACQSLAGRSWACIRIQTFGGGEKKWGPVAFRSGLRPGAPPILISMGPYVCEVESRILCYNSYLRDLTGPDITS